MDQETVTRKSGCCNTKCWLFTAAYLNLLYDFAGASLFLYLTWAFPTRTVANISFLMPSAAIFLLDTLLILFILVKQKNILKCVYYSSVCFVLLIIMLWVAIVMWYRFPTVFNAVPRFSIISDDFLLAVSFGCTLILISLKIIQLVLIKRYNDELIEDDNTVVVVNEPEKVEELKEMELSTINE